MTVIPPVEPRLRPRQHLPGDRRPPGPVNRYPGQLLVATLRNTMGLLRAIDRQFGQVAHYRIGDSEVFVISDPHLIQQVLVTEHRNFHKGYALVRMKRLLGDGLLTSEGDLHRRQRRLIQPAFHRQRLGSYGDAITEAGLRWRDTIRNPRLIDAHEEMTAVTLEIVTRTLFGTHIGDEIRDVLRAFADMLDAYEFLVMPFSEQLEKLPLPIVRRHSSAATQLDSTMEAIIRERRSSGADRGDLLSMLLLARDAETDGARMTDGQVRDECMTFFAAGHETVANWLTWTLYLLAQHPEVTTRLRAEVARVAGSRPPEFGDVQHLEYARMILAESMRLFPPVWNIARTAINACSIGGYEIPVRASLVMSPYVVHRNPRFYPDPERFDPLRWTADKQSSRLRFSYFPFGGGPRLCIGEHFAWMEATLLLSTFVQKLDFTSPDGVRIRMKPGLTLRPRNGVPLLVQRLESS